MRPLALASLLLFTSSLPALAAPRVVASIVPVHSLVAGVMAGVGTPELLLSGQNSEHTASLTPRQLADLGRADLVFVVGDGLEVKLDQLSGTEAVNGHGFVELAKAPGIATLPIREGGAWAPDEDEDHGHGAIDPHLWLDPLNAKAMVAEIARDLAAADPQNAATYARNAAATATRLDALNTTLAQATKPLQGKPYIVFHDAYHYFDHRYGLNPAGSITDIAATPASARRLHDIQAGIKATGALCVFREPQFSPANVEALAGDNGLKVGTLDPLGASLSPGPEAYFTLLAGLARDLASCLTP